MTNNNRRIFLLLCFLFFLLVVARPSMPSFHFLNPLSNQKVSVVSIVRDMLTQRINTYKLKKDYHLLPQLQASSPYDDASAYALVDFDSGEVLAEKNLSQKVSIASLTKIMTAVTILDLVSPDEIITVTENASHAIPTKIVLDPGEKLSVGELLHAALLTSANDAAQALSDGIDAKYGEPIFIKAMNMKAQFIGLKNSRFANPQGFDDLSNFSTAEDLAILSHYALTNYQFISEIVRKAAEYIPATANHKRYVLYNWNGLVDVYPNVYGMKIGNTGDAGMTTVVVSERGGKKLLTIVLGAPGVLERDLWASQLLDYGYERILGLPAFGVTETDLHEKYATWVPWN